MPATLLAVAGALGLAPRLLTGFVDAEVNRLLGADAAREAALELVALGPDTAPAPAAAPLEAVEHATLPLSSSEVDYPLIRAIHTASSLPTADAVRAWRLPGGRHAAMSGDRPTTLDDAGGRGGAPPPPRQQGGGGLGGAIPRRGPPPALRGAALTAQEVRGAPRGA